uniref:Uncharacterized protein n=1 Tax=Oryza punctata TaxID=4537 RepID=A0A0E0JNV5_ORYPU
MTTMRGRWICTRHDISGRRSRVGCLRACLPAMGYGVHANSLRMASFVHALHVGSGYQEFLPASFVLSIALSRITPCFYRKRLLQYAFSFLCSSFTLMVLSRSVCNHLSKARAYAGKISLEPSSNSLPFVVLHNHVPRNGA